MTTKILTKLNLWHYSKLWPNSYCDKTHWVKTQIGTKLKLRSNSNWKINFNLEKPKLWQNLNYDNWNCDNWNCDILNCDNSNFDKTPVLEQQLRLWQNANLIQNSNFEKIKLWEIQIVKCLVRTIWQLDNVIRWTRDSLLQSYMVLESMSKRKRNNKPPPPPPQKKKK